MKNDAPSSKSCRFKSCCSGLLGLVCQLACRNRQLGLVLLREAKQAFKSKFKVYIDSLPREVPTLIHWSEPELQQIQMDSTPTEREFVAQVIIVTNPTVPCLTLMFTALPYSSPSLFNPPPIMQFIF